MATAPRLDRYERDLAAEARQHAAHLVPAGREARDLVVAEAVADGGAYRAASLGDGGHRHAGQHAAALVDDHAGDGARVLPRPARRCPDGDQHGRGGAEACEMPPVWLFPVVHGLRFPLPPRGNGCRRRTDEESRRGCPPAKALGNCRTPGSKPARWPSRWRLRLPLPARKTPLRDLGGRVGSFVGAELPRLRLPFNRPSRGPRRAADSWTANRRRATLRSPWKFRWRESPAPRGWPPNQPCQESAPFLRRRLPVS